MSDEPKTQEGWAVVELMGHVKLAGKLTEVEMFGAKMGRLDIPNEEGFVTQLFGGGSVYRITSVTEAVARQVCKSNSPAPVSPWDFPKQLTATTEPQWATRRNDGNMADDGEDDDNLP